MSPVSPIAWDVRATKKIVHLQAVEALMQRPQRARLEGVLLLLIRMHTHSFVAPDVNGFDPADVKPFVPEEVVV
jgi:hypothetical protein